MRYYELYKQTKGTLKGDVFNEKLSTLEDRKHNAIYTLKQLFSKIDDLSESELSPQLDTVSKYISEVKSINERINEVLILKSYYRRFK